jgi:hypothetical protein
MMRKTNTLEGTNFRKLVFMRMFINIMIHIPKAKQFARAVLATHCRAALKAICRGCAVAGHLSWTDTS